MAEVSFGEWLKRRRKAEGLTQEQLAQQLSCSTITLRKIEAEERRPSAHIVKRLAEIFQIPANEQTAFLRFARGDWQAAPMGVIENAPWLASPLREPNDPSNPKTQLITFLFTDIEDSAKLWESAPEQMKVSLARHHEILEEAVSTNGGTVFQIVGDAFCAAFTTTPSAISAAVTAQSLLYQEAWDLPFPIRVRMGIHTGEAKPTSNDSPTGGYASNQTLNRVARILNAGHGGQVLLSLATKELVKDSLPVGTEFRDMGEHHLKNLIRPEHLFQLQIDGLPSDFPPLNTLTRRHNLPVQLTSFIAREQEIALVREYLSNNDICLVTLIGPPGIGKTRLSVEVAREMLSDFSDGVFFAALAPLEDPNLIAPTIAQTLGFVEKELKPPIERLKEGIGEKQMLLVLDNLEHIIEGAAPIVSELLVSCSRLKILTTSREALRVPGEWLCPVPTLVAPTDNSSIDMELVSQFSALTLFAERARAIKPDFRLNADNIESVARICTQVDGLPLAIELIAARIRLMSPQALLERLSDQFILYTDGMRAVSARQKTLHAAIAWSYDLLSPEEQNLFVRLSVFSGSFTLEAAESIFSRTVTNKSVSDRLALLLDKSLLQRTFDRKARGEPRFNMLVTIQQFAVDCLQHMGEEAEVRNWHLDYFLDLAEQADKEIHGPDQVEWMDRVEKEHDNYRAALDWCIFTQKTESALHLLGALGWSWGLRGYFGDVRSWFDKISALPNVADYPVAYGRALNVSGMVSYLQGDHSNARVFLEHSLSIHQALGIAGESGMANALLYLGMAAWWGDGDIKSAENLFEKATELYQHTQDPRGYAQAIYFLGSLSFNYNNQYAPAFSLFEKSLAIFSELGDLWGIGRLYHGLSGLLSNQGDYTKARPMAEKALAIDNRLGFKLGIATDLIGLGKVCLAQGDDDAAIGYYQASLDISHQFGMKTDKAIALYYLGLLALHRSDYRFARTDLKESLALFHSQGDKANIAECLAGLAAVAGATNQPEYAAKLSGLAQLIIDTLDLQLDPFIRTENNRHIHIAREQLGEVAFETLAAEGRAMTMEQAVAYALEE